ncbi:MarR family winged helix-turn-helix transcriptional regulator [Brachybacterium saurashtrense]|uniref:MarR family winged helix-turn-helix transcriptional regulator n=1 Tax=Brachybacterium saurashtrense TaxID=556288 RepID=UPI0013B35B1A|nr:MarR family transcriptional regulator [Brachybacterium saurashtrense]
MSEQVDGRRREAVQRIQTLLVAISVRSLPRMVGSLLEADLTLKQLKMLTALCSPEPRTSTELVGQMGVSLPTVTVALDRLVQRGLVDRVPDESDHRARRLHLTPLGWSVVAEVSSPDPHLGDHVIAGLERAELEALENGLAAVNRELRRLSESEGKASDASADG